MRKVPFRGFGYARPQHARCSSYSIPEPSSSGEALIIGVFSNDDAIKAGTRLNELAVKLNDYMRCSILWLRN